MSSYLLQQLTNWTHWTLSHSLVFTGVLEVSVLHRGQMVDRHMDIANGILKAQLPLIQGLETPLLSQTGRGFSQPDFTRPVVQFHHVINHWVTSFSGEKDYTVFIYNSLRSKGVAAELKWCKCMATAFRRWKLFIVVPVSSGTEWIVGFMQSHSQWTSAWALIQQTDTTKTADCEITSQHVFAMVCWRLFREEAIIGRY